MNNNQAYGNVWMLEAQGGPDEVDTFAVRFITAPSVFGEPKKEALERGIRTTLRHAKKHGYYDDVTHIVLYRVPVGKSKWQMPEFVSDVWMKDQKL